MKLYNIDNTDRLCSTVEKCTGSVILHMDGGRDRDLKATPELGSFLRRAGSETDMLDVRLQNPTDMGFLIRYMMLP